MPFDLESARPTAAKAAQPAFDIRSAQSPPPSAGIAAPPSIARDVAASFRDILMGIPKLAALPVDAGITAINAAGSLIDKDFAPYRTVSEAADQSLNEMGVPQTRNPVIRAVNEAIGAGPVGIGAKGIQIGREAFAPKAALHTSAQRRAGRAIRESAGTADHRRVLSEQLRNYRSPVKGEMPTAAQVVNYLPEGGPLQELQSAVSKVTTAKAGSPSIEFARREALNASARNAAAEALRASHGEARAKILENANRFSDRLRHLSDTIASSDTRAATNLQTAGKFDTMAAESARRAVYKDAPVGPIGRALGLARDSRSYPSHAAGETPRVPARYTQFAENAKQAKDASAEAVFASDSRKLEAAGAALEKELLENTGLVALGPESILSGVKGKVGDPRVYANEIASRTYDSFVDAVSRVTRKDGSIDARALDEIRMSFGPKLTALFQKEGWNVSDAAFVRAMRASQTFIDDAIEAAGGSGYKDLLSKYHNEITALQDNAERAATMYKPTHAANVPLASAIESQTLRGTDAVPSWLSWKLSAAKNLARALQKNASPDVIREISKTLRDPHDLSFVLDELNAQGASEGMRRAFKMYEGRLPAMIGTQLSPESRAGK